VSNVRGRGLMCAFDLPDPAVRDALLRTLREEDRILLLPSGPRSIRFRPALTISEDDLAIGIKAIAGRLDRLAAGRPHGTA